MRPLVRTPNVRRFVGPIAACCEHYGFNLNRPLNTVDGDEVSIYAIDTEHPYPLVGEVFDYNAGVSWLARWDEQGIYRGTDRATTRHSLQTNSRPHAEIDAGVNRPAPGSANGFNPSDYESFGPHYVNTGGIGKSTKLDAMKIFDAVFGRRPDDKLSEAARRTDSPLGNADQADHFAKLLGKACALALVNGEANPRTISLVASHAARFFGEGRIRVHSEVPSISFTTLHAMIDAMLAHAGSTAVIDMVHLTPTYPTDPRVAEAEARDAVELAQRRSRPGGLDGRDIPDASGRVSR